MINGVDTGALIRREQVQAIVEGVFALTAPAPELLAAARHGIEQVDRIASSAPSTSEELELLEFCEPLEQLAEGLEVPGAEGDHG